MDSINNIIKEEKKTIMNTETADRINDIISNFIRPTKELMTPYLKISDEYYEFRIRQFVAYAYRTIDWNLVRYYKYPKMEQFIIDYANEIAGTDYNRTCATIRVYLKSNFGKLYMVDQPFYRQRKNVYLSFKTQMPEIKSAILSRIKNAIISNKCNFLYIPIGIAVKTKETSYGHRNGLLMFKNKKHWDIYLYEPHGGKNVEYIVSKFIYMLRDYLKEGKEGIIIHTHLVEYKNICPLGLQAKGYDPIGLCVVFSYFWLFNVLIVKFLQPNITIYTIEKTLIEKISSNKDSVELTERMLEFCQVIVFKYIENMTNNPKYPNFITDFERVFKELVEENEKEMKSKHYSQITESDLFFEIEPVKNVRNYTPEDLKEMDEYISQLESGTHESQLDRSRRKRDESPCDNDSDCLSDLCLYDDERKENRCKSREWAIRKRLLNITE
jgi:hypothetical protein